MHAPLRLRTRPMPVGEAGATLSQHLNVSCDTVGSFTHFHTLLHISLFVGSSQIDRVVAGGEGGREKQTVIAYQKCTERKPVKNTHT